MRAMEKEALFNADSLLTSYQVGSILQVNPSSINKWVKDGRIPAFRTPGGHRRFRAADVVAFLSSHSMPIPEALAGASVRRLLIADDDAHTLEALRFALAPYQHAVSVTYVGNTVDALVQIGAIRPHMVVLGTKLGNHDGVELCRQLKAAEQTKSVQVVMLAGDRDGESEQSRAGAAGAQSVLRRPLDVAQVLRELKLPSDR